MDLFEPVKDFFAPEDSSITPRIAPSLPANQKSFATQIRNPDVQALLNKFPGIKPAYLNYQNQRVNIQGSAPRSTPDILPALAAAGRSEAITPEPQGNILQNFASDATNLAQSVWKLPFAAYNEVRALPSIGEKLHQAPTASTPLEQLGNLAQLPGIRMIPGSYLAGTLRPGGPGLLSGAAEHPLYSALDVLPYASKAASASKTVTAARTAAEETQSILRANDLVPGSVTPKVNPISTFVKNVRSSGPEIELRRIGTDELGAPIEAPKLVPNTLGRTLGNLKEDLSSTALGRPLTKAFGTDARAIARASNRASADIIQGQPSQFAEGSVEQAARDIFKNTETRAAESNLTPPERSQIGIAARTGDTSTLTPAQLSIYESQAADAATLGAAKRDAGLLGEVQYSHGPELYPTKTAEIINARRESVSNWRDYFHEHYSTIPEAAPILSNLDSAISSYKWSDAQLAITDLQNLHKFPSIPYGQARTELTKVLNSEARALPARWDTVVKNKLASELTTKYGAGLDSTQTAALAANLWDQILSPEELSKEIQSVKRSWQEIAESTPTDQAPIFVHNISPDKAARALSTPQYFDYTPSISSLKERMFDSAGTVLDLEISLRHEALEILQRNIWDETINRIVRTYGRNGKELTREYLESHGANLDANPTIDAKSALAKHMKNKWAPFNPDSFLNPSRASDALSGTSSTNQLYLPNEIVSTLNELKSQTRGQLSRAADPLMKVFRTSVLTLSPRFYLNNIFGNSLMTLLGSENPATVGRYVKDAAALTKNPEALQSLTLPKSGATLELSRSSIRDLPAQIPELSGMVENIRSLNGADQAAALSFYQQTQAGRALRKLGDNAAMEAARRGVSKAEDFGAKFNSIADNMASSTLFLEGLDNALSKGMTREAATAQGVNHARAAFETWDTLTPTERSVIRSIMPFYGFTRNLLKFVLQYPATHPTRLGILSSFAKAEEQDFGTGLPQQLSQYLYLSPLDTKGRVTAFAPGGINPLQDVGSYASLLGFMAGGQGDLSAITKNLNPILSTTLQELGIDPSRGQADLYPDLYLNPETGQLAAKTGNPLFDLASNTVPQSRVLSNLLGMNQQFSDQLRTNPEAAGRSLLSAAGLPTYARTVDLPTERIKSELTRGQAVKNELTAALKAGEWDVADKWPSLRPMIEKLKKLDPEKLATLKLSDEDVGKIEAAKRGAIGTRE